jgi:hypothetical protein
MEDPRERAQLLDDGLARLSEFWGGELQPRPVQHPRIPIWVASRWPNRRPLRRAARWDGLFPIELPDPDALATLVAEVDSLRGPDASDSFDIVVDLPAAADVGAWEAAGATWVLTDFGSQPRESEVRSVFEGGLR